MIGQGMQDKLHDLNKIARDLLIWPTSKLTTISEEVHPEEIENLKPIVDLSYLLINEINAVGLAAPQIGIQKRFFILDDRAGTRLTCFNPRILQATDVTPTMMEEGCLSLPNQFLPITRVSGIEVAYMSQDQTECSHQLVGLAARIFQHELDHLNGCLIVNYQSRVRRDIVKRKMNHLQRRLS